MPAPTPEAAPLSTVTARWARDRPDRTALTILDDDLDEVDRASFAELDRAARGVCASLVGAGASGRPVILPAEPTVAFAAALFGCFRAGAVAVPVPAQLRRHGRDRVRGIVADAGARFGVATGTASAPLAEAHGELTWLGAAGSAAPVDLAPSGPETPAVLQYTSGSTGNPRGVVVTHRNLEANLGLLRKAYGVNDDSRFLNWLPLFHDLGLVGGLLNAVSNGSPLVLMRPTAFLRRPLHWLRAIDRCGTTISGAPNFAYDLCVRRAKDGAGPALDLGGWRTAFCGAEPVRRGTMERFAEAFAPAGLRRDALYPCYGLAEATLIVTGGRLDGGATTGAGGAAGPAAAFVSCGRPLAEGSVAIVDPETGLRVADGEMGEIWVAGDHVAARYWNAGDAAAFNNGLPGADAPGPYLRTGDLGFLRGGELWVSGRLKDVIIHRGEKLHAQDVEATIAESHPGFGSVGAAFSVDEGGAEQVAAAFEVASLHRLERERAEMVDRAVRAVAEAHGVRLFDLVLVRPGSLPRTTSGKIQRGAVREDHRSGRLRASATPGPAGAPMPPAGGRAPPRSPPA